MTSSTRTSERIVSSRRFPLLSIFSVAAPSFCALAFVFLYLLGSSHAAPVAVIALFLVLGSSIAAFVALICGERPLALPITALLFNLALLSLGLYFLHRVFDLE